MHVARQRNHIAVVEIDSGVSSGERSALDSLESLCSGLAQAGTRCILLDMNGVRTAPSVLLATLASLQGRVRALGGELAVINPTNPVRKAFRVTVMDQVVGLYNDEAAALKAVEQHLAQMRRTLQDDLCSPRALTRIEAAAKLARIGDDQGITLLEEALSDKDPVMRLQVTLSLAGLGDARAVQPLIKALGDEDYRVRMYAAEALGRIADARAIEPLKAAVRFERNRNVIFKANQALEQLLGQRPFTPA